MNWKFAALVGVMAGSMALPIRGQSYTYTGIAAVPLDWTSDPAWSATPVSGVGTALIFGGGASLADGAAVITNNNLAGPFSLNSLTFNYAGPESGTTRPTVTITGAALTFVNNGGVAPVLNAIASGGTNLAPNLIIENQVNLGNTLTVDGTSNVFLSGLVSGAGGLTKIGAGTAVLNGANEYLGVTTVSAGILSVRHGSGLGSTDAGTVVASGAQLQLEGGITVSGETLTIKGEGGGTATVQGALRNVSGNNVWTGSIAADTSVITRVVSTSGTLSLGGQITMTGTHGNGLVFQGDGAIVVSGDMSGDGSITRSSTGTGRLLLTGVNTFGGNTTVSNGTVQYGRLVSFYNGVVSTTTLGKITVANGATLAFNVGGAGEFTAAEIDIVNDRVFSTGARLGIDTTNAGAVFTYGVALTNWGNGANALGLTKTGDNMLQLTAANSYTGSTMVNGGTLKITHELGLGTAAGGTAVGSGATLQLQGGLTVVGEALSLAGEGVSNAGTLRSISGNNVWTGNISANTSSIVRITSETAGQTLTLAGDITTTGTNSNGLVLQGNGNITVTGNIVGNGSLTKSSMGTGLLLLTGANTYGGSTLISNAVLQVGQAGVGSIANTSSVLVNGGTLSGTGTVGGPVNLSSGANAFLSPGDSGGVDAGQLILSKGLVLASGGGADIKFDLRSTIDSDLILMTGGSLIGNSSGLTTFHFTTGAGFGNGVYRLIDGSADGVVFTGVEASDFNFTGLSAAYSSSYFEVDEANRLVLFHVVVPEPSRAGLLLLSGVGLMAAGRRRRPADR